MAQSLPSLYLRPFYHSLPWFQAGSQGIGIVLLGSLRSSGCRIVGIEKLEADTESVCLSLVYPVQHMLLLSLMRLGANV